MANLVIHEFDLLKIKLVAEHRNISEQEALDKIIYWGYSMFEGGKRGREGKSIPSKSVRNRQFRKK